MLKNLLDVLLGSEKDKLDDDGEKIALAALCVRVAKSDNVYEPSEVSSIDTELSQHFSISMADAAVLREQAEKLEQEAPDTVRFTRAIKEKIELGKRREILETLWKITLADGKREAEEDSLIRLISSLLGLTDIESARARQKVAKN
ncbi:TerB family tellurite resistance protein [Paracoccaceae bacterium]|nr:TerB family tellurite resistance protein [Paracoccaceae bacterium]